MIHGRVTLHGFSSMIVIHDSSMICNVEKFVQMFELANLANLAKAKFSVRVGSYKTEVYLTCLFR